MAIDADLSFLEVLGIEINFEIEAAGAYGRLAKRVRNVDLKDKPRFLTGGGRKHKAVLEEMYAIP